jgi:hypothetical protein
MQHAYCTYFDHNYLPRALLMLRSLRAHDPQCTVYVLALSDMCRTILDRLALPNVEVIPLAALENAYPELREVKPKRSAIEYIFTLTPFLPLYLFNATAAEMLTYIDADVYFYSSPRPLLESISRASIAITPHRFSAYFRPWIIYGRFNVGWVSFRRCAEAFDCLASYKADCIAWCYDRVENGRFADQGYLNSWPDRYPSLTIIEHKGVNVAVWNAENYVFEERGGQLLVDGEKLIFYHFHGLKLRPDGSLDVKVPPRHGAEGVLMRRIMEPYLDAFMRERADLHSRFPELAGVETNLRYRETTPAQPVKRK